jgi:hypothetical protein
MPLGRNVEPALVTPVGAGGLRSLGTSPPVSLSKPRFGPSRASRATLRGWRDRGVTALISGLFALVVLSRASLANLILIS